MVGIKAMRDLKKNCVYPIYWVLLVLLTHLTLTSAYSTPSVNGASFINAKRGYNWSFPSDHGPHSGYQSEWWYYTGQLYTPGASPFQDRPHYGYQLTFFRRQSNPAAPSDYLAHAALTDIRAGRTYFSARRGGGLLGVAGATPGALEVWSGDWLAELIDERQVLRFSADISGALTRIRLIGAPQIIPWLQGERGFSLKGGCDSCGSNYYSLARIPFSGELRAANSATRLHGLGWMDHEFMSNTLSADQVGWDWFGLMFKDGRNLMVFSVRGVDGESVYRSASLQRGAAGAVSAGELATSDEVRVTPSGERSVGGASGVRYPLEWRVEVARWGIDVVVRARVSDCEVGGSSSDNNNSAEGTKLEPRYWEGPVASEDEGVIGYLEMTGYAGRVGV